MNPSIKLIILAILITALGLGGHSSVFAKGGRSEGGKPSGFSKGEKKGWEGQETPPGWSHGKKKGWSEEGVPPGFSKKDGKMSKSEAENLEKTGKA